MGDLTIITTADGSHSLFNSALNETYHSVHGAIQESLYVFIQQGLDYWLERNPGKEVRILEIGFGTGLNALLTLQHSSVKGIKVYYESWEAFPLPKDVLIKLNYPDLLRAANHFEVLHQASWNKPTAITPHFTLYKHDGDILLNSLPQAPDFDIVYYDAFAPSKQPDLWTEEVLRKVTETLAVNGIWVTYCAKGQLKRDLKSLGLTVETLPGPPGKKEMVRAFF